MSSVILTNWTVYYSNDAGAGAGMKQIKWTGTTGTNTLNELYSALMHLFDNASQNDAADSIPIRAVTPTLYEIGSFDAGDRRPWFIDPESVKHLSGGGLNTANWQRDLSSRTASHGIVKITRTGTNIVAGDIGATITNSTNGDDGWLLHVDGDTLWIRPDTSTLGDDWDSSSGTITCNSHSDTQASAAISAESIWSNIYSLGTIESYTEIYVYQNQSPLTQWWTTGHTDILVLTTDFGSLIDEGLLTVYARQYSKLYDHFTVDVALGGRTPIPLATGADSNNTTGYRQMVLTTASGNFTVGEVIEDDTDSTIQGRVTANSGTAPNITLDYYLIGSALTDFSAATGGFTGQTSGTTATAVNSTSTGPTTTPSSTLTIGFAGIERDLSNGNGSRPYSVEIDLLDSISVALAYERLKYLTRRGQTTDIDTQTSQSLIGQEYTAIGDYYLPYDTGSVDNPFTEGETITASGSFSCTLTSKHDQGTSEGFLIVRNVRGTIPVDNTTLTGTTSGHTALIDEDSGSDPVEAITPIKQSPFGTFAGGKFFGARGVWLANVPALSANSYELIDSEGISQTPPLSVAITILNTQSGDSVSVFRTTGDNEIIDKAQFYSYATNNVSGWGFFEVTDPIPADTPSTGSLRVPVRDAQDRIIREHRYPYSSWSGYVFTLDGTTLSQDYDGQATAYIPYIDREATSTSVSEAITYVTDRYVLVRVRIAGMLPFKIGGQLTTSGLTVSTIRTQDAVYL